MIPYGKQSLDQADIDAVVEVLKSDWLTQGPTIERFEAAMAQRCEAGYGVAVCNATAALHIACLAAGLGQGDRLWTSLTASSGKSVSFLTGLALYNSSTGHCQVDCIPFTVHMRALDQASISRYLHAEQPYDCAGSFKAEGLGVTLFRSTEGPDATSLIGLPLIRLVDMLTAEGVQLP